jgi:hypothetical protein
MSRNLSISRGVWLGTCATGDMVRVDHVEGRGLCTTQHETMGPARQQCHAMGHRQHSSSAWAVHNTTRHHGPGTTEMSCHGPQTTQFKCVGCAQHNKTPWARHDRNVMPWATDNTVQVRGLCTTQQDTMGPARQQCHAMGLARQKRRQWSSVWAVQSHTRRNTHTTDTHLVALVDAFEPLEGKSKTVPLIQGTRRRLF